MRDQQDSPAQAAGEVSAEPITPPATPHSMKPDIPQEITNDRLLGKIDPATDDQFVVIEPRYASRSGMYMHQQAYRAFVEMHQAARQEGISLTIMSAMRTFDHQKRIWNNKWNGSTILQG
ncbi:MAG: D-alanyl-D-alanine carboxypeptidase family protein, partial [Bacteroidales bacterium]